MSSDLCSFGTGPRLAVDLQNRGADEARSTASILRRRMARQSAAEASTLIDATLSTIYREYIDCLNRQDWADLEQFVHEEVYHNGEQIGLAGYREMLEKDFREIRTFISTFNS